MGVFLFSSSGQFSFSCFSLFLLPYLGPAESKTESYEHEPIRPCCQASALAGMHDVA